MHTVPLSHFQFHRMVAGAIITTWHRPFSAHMVPLLFFSREEPRLHVHVYHAEGEAKFWLEPQIAQALIEEHEHDIRDAWQRHFGS